MEAIIPAGEHPVGAEHHGEQVEAIIPAGEHPVGAEHHGEQVEAIIPAGEHPVKPKFFSIFRGQQTVDIEDPPDKLVSKAKDCNEPKRKHRDGREATRAKKQKQEKEKDPQQREVRPRISESIYFWRVVDFSRVLAGQCMFSFLNHI